MLYFADDEKEKKKILVTFKVDAFGREQSICGIP